MQAISQDTKHAHWPTDVLQLKDVLSEFRQESVRGAVATGNYRCNWLSWGKGPALIFIHGLADDCESFVLPMAQLKTQFQCIAYDLPTGQNDSANMFAYRHEHLVEDLLALLDHLQLERVFLVGSSFGATIAMRAMTEQPRRFPKAVLQGAFARRPLAANERALTWLGRFLPGPMYWFPFRQRSLRSDYGEVFAARESAVWDYFVERCCRPPMAALAHRGRMLVRMDLRAILCEILQPVLMVCGELDQLVGAACETELEHGLPRAHRVDLRECGHHPYFTHPESYAAAILNFLAK